MQVNLTLQANTSAGQKVIHIKLPNQLTSQPLRTQQVSVQQVSSQPAVVEQVQAPMQSPTPQGYKPLESLKEVKRHAESSVSPMTALMSDELPSLGLSPALGRQKVTVNDRYRYIAPSALAEQTAAGAAKVVTIGSGEPAVQIATVPSVTATATSQLQAQPQIISVHSSSVQQQKPQVVQVTVVS